MSVLAVNDVTAVRVRLFVPGVGAWLADCDLDVGSDKPLPSGKVVLTINQAKLSGTIDPRASGRVGEKASVRVVAGANGWHKVIDEQTFHNDAGLKSNVVVTSTASAVGESAVDANPVDLDVDYIRSRAPAVRVLKDRAWYIDDKGVTHVAKRANVKMPTDFDLLAWDPYTRTAELAGESILWPGTILEDERIGDAPHQAIVRDVEHVFDANGARVTAMCTLGQTLSVGSSRALALMQAAVRQFAGTDHLKTYRYRIAKQGIDGRLYLQPVRKSSGIPDTLPISIFPGMAGDSAEYVLGTECLVAFVEGDPSRPLVVAFDGKEPTKRRIKAKTKIIIGDDDDAPAAARKGDHVHGGFFLFASAGTLITASSPPGVNGWYPPTANGLSSAQSDQSSNPGSVIVPLGNVPIGPAPFAGGCLITDGSGKTVIE